MKELIQLYEAWDAADGISFWVKGDGSKNFGGIELIDHKDYALRYAYCFPLDSTEWKKITSLWFIPKPARTRLKPPNFSASA